MIVLDASVLIGFFETPDVHHPAALELLNRHAAHELGASPITLTEFLVGPARRDARFVREAQHGLERMQVAQIGLTGESPRLLADLRVTTGLRMPDCAVLHAAQRVGGAVASFDERLCRAAEELGVPLA